MRKHIISAFNETDPPAEKKELAWLLAEAVLETGQIEDDVAQLVVNRLIDSIVEELPKLDEDYLSVLFRSPCRM